jgi:hypothetical protein
LLNYLLTKYAIEGSIMPANIAPQQIQKQLRKETFYGCALCGCPILEYVHIVPHTEVQAFLPENMVTLCPFHHIKYDNREITEGALREAKINPFNKIEEDAFIIGQSQDMVINIGKCKFINTSRILVLDDFDIISIRRGGQEQQDNSKKYLLLDINFFDKFNNLIAVVSENSWTAERRSSSSNGDWNITYHKPKHLVIQNSARNILFDAKVNNNEITLIVNGIYYNGSSIRITENEILLDNTEIATDLKGTVLKNYDVGIVAETVRY